MIHQTEVSKVGGQEFRFQVYRYNDGRPLGTLSHGSGHLMLDITPHTVLGASDVRELIQAASHALRLQVLRAALGARADLADADGVDGAVESQRLAEDLYDTEGST